MTVQIECQHCGHTEEIDAFDSEWHYHEDCGGRMRVVPGQFENPEKTTTDKI